MTLIPLTMVVYSAPGVVEGTATALAPDAYVMQCLSRTVERPAVMTGEVRVEFVVHNTVRGFSAVDRDTALLVLNGIRKAGALQARSLGGQSLAMGRRPAWGEF